MIINELKLPFPFYRRRLRQTRFRENCAGVIPWGLIMPKNAFLPFQARIEGVPQFPTVTEWKLNRVCPQFVTTVVRGEWHTEFEGAEFFTQQVGNVTKQLPSTLQIIHDELLDEDGNAIVDQNGDAILTGEVSIVGETYNLAGIIPSHLRVVKLGDGYNIVYNGKPFDFPIDCGYYEMFIKLSGGASFWSEVFQIVEYNFEEMPYIELSWRANADMDRIVYSQGYTNRVYFNAFISHSEPQITETVKADGLGVERVITALHTDRYVLSEVVPDFMKTALTSAMVCPVVRIEHRKTEVSFSASRMRTTTQLEGSGCQSFVEMQFDVDNELFRDTCS